MSSALSDGPWWALVTERMPVDPRESRVHRTVVRLRGPEDSRAINQAIKSGALRPQPGVRAWAQQWR